MFSNLNFTLYVYFQISSFRSTCSFKSQGFAVVLVFGFDVYPCLSLLIGAYRSDASHSIATLVTGSGQYRRDAAGSFLGELANFLERESEGNPWWEYFVG